MPSKDDKDDSSKRKPRLHVIPRDAPGQFISQAKSAVHREVGSDFTFSIDPDHCEDEDAILAEFRESLPQDLVIEGQLPVVVVKIPFIDADLGALAGKCQCKCNYASTCGGGGGGGGS